MDWCAGVGWHPKKTVFGGHYLLPERGAAGYGPDRK